LDLAGAWLLDEVEHFLPETLLEDAAGDVVGPLTPVI